MDTKTEKERFRKRKWEEKVGKEGLGREERKDARVEWRTERKRG